MSIVEDLLHAIAAALTNVDAAASPEQSLLIATTEVVTGAIDGRGVITRDRLLDDRPDLHRAPQPAKTGVVSPQAGTDRGTCRSDGSSCGEPARAARR